MPQVRKESLRETVGALVVTVCHDRNKGRAAPVAGRFAVEQIIATSDEMKAMKGQLSEADR